MGESENQSTTVIEMSAPSSEENSWEAILQNRLEGRVPSDVKSDLPEQKQTSQQVIDEINSSAYNKLLGILDQGETERIKQQKPLRDWLLRFIGFQMLSFNVIIGYMVLCVCGEANAEIISDVLDFLKYYIGAVLVELIGMVWFITKSTFTSSSKDIIKGFLNKLSK